MKNLFSIVVSVVLLLAGKVGLKAQGIQTVYAFTNTSFNGPRDPATPLVLGKEGNFYGTTTYGGSGGFGTVYKITTDGTFTVLATFNGTTGMDPGGVTFGQDGNLYGTCNAGGAGSVGTIFRVSPNGGQSTIYSFSYPNGSQTNSDGGYPESGLVLGPDGYLYGTTSGYGPNGNGTVFKVSTSGVLTTLYSFDAGVSSNSSGAGPRGAMTFGLDGNLYGTAFVGGPHMDGTVFRITTNGVFTRLLAFDSTNGADPQGNLVTGPDGLIYGTALNGGGDGKGTVFKMTTNGVLTTLVNFINANGGSPSAGVTFGPDGNLYGTSTTGSTNNYGNIFRLTTNGALTTLASFNNTNGAEADGGVTFSYDGTLYGTVFYGSTAGAGAIYRINAGLTVTNKSPAISWSNGGVTLHLASTSGSTNRLWVTTNLTAHGSQWQSIATNIATNGFVNFTDANTTGIREKFYRLSTP